MSEYFVIDAHVHTYKTPEIGLQAMSGAGRAGCYGTPDELLKIMDEAGIDLAVQVNMTPAKSMFEAAMAKVSPEERDSAREAAIEKITGRVRRRNEWTCQMAREHPRLVPFPSVDPIMKQADMTAEIMDKFENFGAKGLKLHPAEGCFFPEDPVLEPVYETAEKVGLPIISHGGIFITDKEYTRPINFTRVLEDFPELTFVIAHLGHGYWDESVEMAQKYPNLFFDTSAAIHGAEGHRPLSDDEAVELIRKIGVDRVMFGSDFPWYHPGQDL
ncbi:MAG: amidohydrolase, partial [Deltaproteobacteria bacterium]|nr:amidohydrolase [Deltaproteobacteria bacterium]MBW2051772.1 amidohydrolase [Deltaproteobacteria bacterium]MBW2322358.1 amidohydrolase [Deltaproteobacteria bacterium]